jgi:hypothetical protein
MRSSRESREVTLPDRPAAASGARQQLGSRLHRYLVDLDDSAQGLTDGESLSSMEGHGNVGEQLTIHAYFAQQTTNPPASSRHIVPPARQASSADFRDGRWTNGTRSNASLPCLGIFARPRVGRVTISCVGSLPQVFLLAALDTGVDAPMRYKRWCGPEAQECVFRGRVRQSSDVELLPVVVILMRDFFLLGTRCR